MSDITDPTAGFGVPILGSGFTDLLAVILDAPRETAVNRTALQITADNLVSAKVFSLELKQQSVAPGRHVGEGADPNTLDIGLITIKGTVKMPLIEPPIGWVEPVFAVLWDRARLAWWGTGTACIGNLLTAVSAGDQTLVTDNIADFADLPTPFTVRILAENELGEEIVVSSVTKSQRQLHLASAIRLAHSSASVVMALPFTASGPEREPAFSLLSMREGLLSPSLVNTLTIEADAGKAVDITVEIRSLSLYRDHQIDMRANQQAIRDLISSRAHPERLMNGTNIRLSPASALSGAFGLSSALGDPLFAGFQGLGIPDLVITGISIKVDNRLEEVYTSHSILSNLLARRRENSYPYALVSQGRVISGTIRYRSPLEAWQVAERLAGPSSLAGGGLIVDFGNFQIVMSEIAWSPASSNGDDAGPQTRELAFTMVSETRNAMPRLDFSSQA